MNSDGLGIIPENSVSRRQTIQVQASGPSNDYGAPLISKNPANLGSQIRTASAGVRNFQRALGANPRAQFARMSTALNATKDDMDADKQDLDVTAETTESVAKPVVVEPPKEVGLYSWFVLAILVSIRVIYQWQRSIFSYSYGYKGIGM